MRGRERGSLGGVRVREGVGVRGGDDDDDDDDDGVERIC